MSCILFGNFCNPRKILVIEKYWIFEKMKESIDPNMILLVYVRDPKKLSFLQGRKGVRYIGDLDPDSLKFLQELRSNKVYAKYSGPSPSLVKKHPKLTIKLSAREKAKLKTLTKSRDPEIKRLANFLIKTGRKMEIEALVHLGRL